MLVESAIRNESVAFATSSQTESQTYHLLPRLLMIAISMMEFTALLFLSLYLLIASEILTGAVDRYKMCYMYKKDVFIGMYYLPALSRPSCTDYKSTRGCCKVMPAKRVILLS